MLIYGAKIVVNDYSMMRCILSDLRESSGFVTNDAVTGIVKSHHELLASLSGITGQHYQGLQQASRLNSSWLPGAVVKRLQRLDAAFAELRHFTEAGHHELHDKISEAASSRRVPSSASDNDVPSQILCSTPSVGCAASGPGSADGDVPIAVRDDELERFLAYAVEFKASHKSKWQDRARVRLFKEFIISKEPLLSFEIFRRDKYAQLWKDVKNQE